MKSVFLQSKKRFFWKIVLYPPLNHLIILKVSIKIIMNVLRSVIYLIKWDMVLFQLELIK
jgi:hypothetical protein